VRRISVITMNERDFHLVMRAKRQVHRETALRSMLIFSSDLIANFGLVSKDNLIKVIEKQLHSDPEMLTRYLNRRSRSKVGS
jgi:hypothetical protein